MINPDPDKPRLQITLLNTLKLLGVAAVLMWLNAGLYAEHQLFGWPITAGEYWIDEYGQSIQTHGAFAFCLMDAIFCLFVLWLFFLNLRRNYAIRPWHRGTKLTLSIFTLLALLDFCTGDRNQAIGIDRFVHHICATAIWLVVILRVCESIFWLGPQKS